MTNRTSIALMVTACVLVLAGAWAVPAQAFQAELQEQTKALAEEGVGFGKPTDPRVVAGQIIRGLLGLTSILFLAYTVYAGYLYMSSAGDSDKIETAKKTIKYGIIGILISLSAYSILRLVSNFQKAQEEPPDGFRLEFDSGQGSYECQGDKTKCGG